MIPIIKYSFFPQLKESTKSTLADAVLGFIIFLSTTLFFGNYLLLVPIIYIFIKNKISIKQDFLLLIFSFLAIINILVHIQDFEPEKNFSSLAVIITPLMAISSRYFTYNMWRYFSYFVIIEIFTGLVEYYLGISTIFTTMEFYHNIDSELMYENRILGLSANSSVFALKIFISFFVLNLKKTNVKFSLSINGLLVVGLILTFNRTTIIAVAIYLIALQLRNTKANKNTLFAFVFLILFALLNYFGFIDILTYNFNRGAENGFERDTTRLEYWKTAYDFIQQSFILGNGSLIYRIYDSNWTAWMHAHNSFLMLFATHGVFLSSLVLINIFLKLDRKNVYIIISIFFYSSLQYGIFWNLSLLDIFLYWSLSRKLSFKHTPVTTPQQG